MLKIPPFVYCILISLGLIFFPVLLGFGGTISSLFFLFPYLFAGEIVGEPINYLNGGDKHSFIYYVVFIVLIIIQVLLIALIFYGIYCVYIFFFPHKEMVAIVIKVNPVDSKYLLICNTALIFFTGIMLITFAYNFFSYFPHIKETMAIVKAFLFPFILYIIIIIFALKSRNFINGNINAGEILVGLGFVAILLISYAFFRNIYNLFYVPIKYKASLPIKFYINSYLGIVYQIFVGWYIVQLLLTIKESQL